MNFFQIIHQTFRCCLHCGSFQCGKSQFCSSCENDLWRAHSELQEFYVGDSPFQGTALFDWYPDQDRKVSKLMVSLKGGRLEQTLYFYSQEFVARLKRKLPEHCVLVPCPSRGQRLHSQVFAKAFSEILEIPLIDSLRKLNSGDQKSKNKSGRQKVKISNDVDFSKHHVIFIDDIVTTGSTALSAYKAIGSCTGFEVWCLAHRRQLAAFSRF